MFLSCKEASRLVSESLDRELSLYQRLTLRLHLVLCYLCARYEKHLLLIRNAVSEDSSSLEQSELMQEHALSAEAKGRLEKLVEGELKGS